MTRASPRRPSLSVRWRLADKAARKDAFWATSLGRVVRDPANAELAADSARSRWRLGIVLSAVWIFLTVSAWLNDRSPGLFTVVAVLNAVFTLWFWRSDRINRRVIRVEPPVPGPGD